MDHKQLAKLLTTRRTDLLSGFIFGKTGRPFKAYLVLDDSSQVTFDFPSRDKPQGCAAPVAQTFESAVSPTFSRQGAAAARTARFMLSFAGWKTGETAGWKARATSAPATSAT